MLIEGQNSTFLVKLKYCSFKPLINDDELAWPVNWSEQFHREAPIEVEIGFGMGEVLMRLAKEFPERNFIGLEQNWERICKTLSAIHRIRRHPLTSLSLDNIRILSVDARIVFERFFTEQTIDKIYCLFPCPWPKKRHIKHRLFSNAFFNLLNNRLRKNGELKIVTDSLAFFEWMRLEGNESGFRIETQTIKPQYQTKFERKWQTRGQKEFFELRMLKETHIKIPQEKNTAMKSYRLKFFNPDQFQFENATGEISVVLKEVIFDPRRQKAMIHTVVSEAHLTQHFWVMIFKEDNMWRVCKADGQKVFATPGTARALELVYEAAKKMDR